MPIHDGTEVIDLVNWTQGAAPGADVPPLINPDATGPIHIGGLELASPDDGALINDILDGRWGNVAVLLADLFGG